MISKNAFTLIESLVVIAIIVLQLAVLMPLLGASREQALESVCLSNQKQLSLAWTCYYNDHDGLLVRGTNYSGWFATPYRWVEYPMDDNGNLVPESQYSLQTRQNGIRAGKLFPYTQDESLYHCPEDQNITNPEPYSTFRSYSIAGLMNGEDYASQNPDGTFNYRTAVTSPTGSVETLILAVNFSDITTPSSKYVFVEENAVRFYQTVLAGSFVLLSGSMYDWWDIPASFHGDKSTFGFADGHAQLRQWQDPDTINLINGGYDPDPSGNEDLHWLVNGYLPATP